MNDLPDAIAQIDARLTTLEQRVSALEHPVTAPHPMPAQTPGIEQPALAGSTLSLVNAGGMIPVIGKAMLGIAGAYLLRAAAEAKIAPQAAIATIAIVYAIFWLIWAVRTPRDAWFGSATYACTSALILAPMLWELTLRFKVLTPAATACALAAFVASAFAFTWKNNRPPVLWLVNGMAAVLAVSLSIATREFAPFVALLLLMVLLSECGAALDHASSVRILTAAAADLIIWILIYIFSNPQGTDGEYPNHGTASLIAPGITLFFIFTASVMLKTVLRRRNITVFETIQTTVAFMLAASSILYFGTDSAATSTGALCVALSALGYAVIILLFNRENEGRNYAVFATWSAALFLAGGFLCIPPSLLPTCLGAAAVGVTIAGARLHRHALELHGAVYLVAGAAGAGLASYLFNVLAGTMPGPPAWNVCIAAVCGIVCYGATSSRVGEQWKLQVLHLAIAAIAAASATALLVQALTALVTLRLQPGAHHLAFIRTLILCAAALCLAFGGAWWRRLELIRIGYAALGLIAIKLVLEDLALGHLAYIAASIFLFAITLIAIPRLAHIKRQAPSPSLR